MHQVHSRLRSLTSITDSRRTLDILADVTCADVTGCYTELTRLVMHRAAFAALSTLSAALAPWLRNAADGGRWSQGGDCWWTGGSRTTHMAAKSTAETPLTTNLWRGPVFSCSALTGRSRTCSRWWCPRASVGQRGLGLEMVVPEGQGWRGPDSFYEEGLDPRCTPHPLRTAQSMHGNNNIPWPMPRKMKNTKI